MKFVITHTDGWRWNLTAANGRVIASGESYERPQKMVQSLNRYIVRGDDKLQLALTTALTKLGLDPSGKQIMTPVADSNGMRWVDKK